jgi:acyl transferase domain-containing protein
VAGLAALLGRTDSAPDPRAAALERTEVVQPALFAVEYALARTLQAWGVQPQVMLGYSLGEYVAACLAGVLSLPDAVALVCHRAKLIATVTPGSMIAVSLTAEQLQARFPLAERQLDIAAFNGPQVTVVAGPVPAVQALAEDLREAEVPCRLLSTTHAFHSRMLEQVGEQLTSWVAANVRLNAPQLTYISNLTGGYAEADLVCDPGYWARHMCQPVQFAAGVQTLLADPELAVLEVGPGQSLGALIRGAGAEPRQWPLILSLLPAANDNRPDDAVLTDALARLWLLGVELDWMSHHDRQPGAQAPDVDSRPGRVPLPTYPFQRQRYWIDGAPRGLSGALPAAAPAQSGPASQDPAEMSFDTIAALPKLAEEQWLHLPVWRQTALPAAAVDQPGSWLVYTRAGVADDLVAGLRRELPDPASVSIVRPGDGYASAEDGYTVRPGNVADTLALLRDLRAAGRQPDRVVHLWALEPASDEVVLSHGVHTLVALARAAGELGMDSWSLDVAVSGTQQVLDDDVSQPYAATLTGPCRVIPLEYPNVRTRLIDLDPIPDRAAVAGLLAELRRPQSDALVALRHGRRWLSEYQSMAAPPVNQGQVLRTGGVYLITGGLGGIALAMAERLARDCRAKLVLLGRSGLPPASEWSAILDGDPADGDPAASDPADDRIRRRVAAVSRMLEHGAEVEIVTGDVADTDDVRRAVELALTRFGALHGVLHVAGLPAMGLMQFKQPAELDLVLAPKVAGTLAIADALRIGKPEEIELDFLALFSSITSTTGGGPGQVDYCSANAFLDSYAYQLAATGRRVVSINWGEWTWNAWEEGLTGYADVLQAFFRENRSRIGIGFEEGWRSLLRVLACDEPRIVVSTQDFPTMVGYSSKFTVAAVTSTAMAGGGSRHPRPELVTSYQEPTGAVEAAIAAIWCESLQLEQVGAADNFFELGGNSLLGVSIVAALRGEFAPVELPPHILYEAPTVAALARVIESAQSGATTPASGADGDGGSQVRAQLRRSGLEASAGRRRARQGQQALNDRTGTETEQS